MGGISQGEAEAMRQELKLSKEEDWICSKLDEAEAAIKTGNEWLSLDDLKSSLGV